jgi:hypothetical protein
VPFAMRVVSCISIPIATALGSLLGLALGPSTLPPEPQHCITYQEKTLRRWHTLCPDGTTAMHRWNSVLERWESTITPPRQHPSKAKPRR